MDKRNGMLYPLMVIASLSVVLFSIIGIATMTGHMPAALSQKDNAIESQNAATSSSGTNALTDAELPAVQKQSDITNPVQQKANVHSSPTQALREPERVAITCANCGVVESVQVREIKGQGSALGVIGGAVLGGIVGHQVGAGRGNDLATVAGAVGGGYAGHEIERNVKKTHQYVVRVRMEDGAYRTIRQSVEPNVGVGDRVRIENGRLVARN